MSFALDSSRYSFGGWVARPLWAVLACLSLALAGCGHASPQRAPVGKITFQNRPLEGAFVALHPRGAAAGAPPPTAHVGADGAFRLTTFDTGDGAPPGEYVLTVQWHRLVQVGGDWQPGPNLLPPKYSNPATSDVIVRVVEGQSELPPIVLR